METSTFRKLEYMFSLFLLLNKTKNTVYVKCSSGYYESWRKRGRQARHTWTPKEGHGGEFSGLPFASYFSDSEMKKPSIWKPNVYRQKQKTPATKSLYPKDHKGEV